MTLNSIDYIVMDEADRCSAQYVFGLGVQLLPDWGFVSSLSSCGAMYLSHIFYTNRLLELGFAVQLRELLQRVPETRQTLLFSATLPASLAEFARAGLRDPALVRLDVDTKISEKLEV